MASTLAIPAVLASVRALLVADASLAAMLATVPSTFGSGPAIYAENAVPQPPPAMPYLTLGAATEVPFNTFGAPDLPAYGSSLTFQVKAFSKEMADDGNYSRLNRVKAVLDGQSLTVSGYLTAFCEFESASEPFVELVSGIAIRQFPVIFRATVHQS